MAVLIENIDKPPACIFCIFVMRIDNAKTACQLFPSMEPVDDGNQPPPYCPIKEATKIGREYIGYSAYDTWRTTGKMSNTND